MTIISVSISIGLNDGFDEHKHTQLSHSSVSTASILYKFINDSTLTIIVAVSAKVT